VSETAIGVARPRLDAPDKVTGATRYAADGPSTGSSTLAPVLSTKLMP
jgi:CO/xanthine dehydrogenase Mo-binding subunit